MEGPPSEVANRRGLYEVTLSRIVHDRSLRQETIFECVLFIPNTPYRITRRLIYYPGPFASSIRSPNNEKYFPVALTRATGDIEQWRSFSFARLA